MTLTNTATRNDYTTASATQTAFVYSFKIVDQTHIAVYVAGVLKTLGSDYTVSGVGGASGGTVTLLVAPASGVAVALSRSVPYTQPTAFPTAGPFLETTIEALFDRIVMMVQQAVAAATRAVQVSAGSAVAATGITLPNPLICGKYLQVNSTCDGFNQVGLTAVGTYVNPVTTKGDLIQGGSAGAQERLAISATEGAHVVRDPATAKVGWAPGLGGALVNHTAASVAANNGKVFAVDDGCDRAFRSADVQGCNRAFIVSTPTATQAVGANGLTVSSGQVRNVVSQGAIARGRYVRKSATANAVEDAGVTVGAGMPPAGTIGQSLNAAAAGVVDLYLFGWTMPDLDKAGTKSGPPTNLKIKPNDSVPASRIDVTADIMRAGAYLKSTYSVTINCATVGANGIDAGALAASTGYAVWAIYNVTADTWAGLVSTSETAPTMPAGYTVKVMIGYFLTSAASVILAFVQLDDEFTWYQPRLVVTSNATVATLLNLAGCVPNTAVKSVAVSLVPGATRKLYMHYDSKFTVSDAGAIVGAGATTSLTAQRSGTHILPTANCTRTSVYYASSGATSGLIYLHGFRMQFKG